MTGRTTSWLPLGTALLVLVLGCGDDGHASPAPDHDGGRVSPPPGVSGGDAGRDAGDGRDGAAGGDAGVELCFEVDPGDPDTFLEVDQGDLAEPFVLERAFIGWTDVDCDERRLLIGLTDGACQPGVGQQLLLSIDPGAVGLSVVIGDNVLSVEPTPLRVQFSRGEASERDLFGTCAGATEGERVHFTAIGTETGASQTGALDRVLLAPCTEPLDQPAVFVTGAFDLTLPVGFETVCP